jgi:hypothetical protein
MRAFEEFEKRHVVSSAGSDEEKEQRILRILRLFVETDAVGLAPGGIPAEQARAEAREAQEVFERDVAGPLKRGTSIMVSILNGVLSICRYAIPFAPNSWGRFMFRRAIDVAAISGAVCSTIYIQNTFLGSLLAAMCMILKEKLNNPEAHKRRSGQESSSPASPSKRARTQ